MAGVSQPSPLAPVLDRARSLIASGQFDSAQVLLERAVEVGREKLGEDEPIVLTAARELAGVYLRTDDPMAARRVLEDAYAAGQWRLGDSDPVMLHISHDIGVVAQELGNKHEARKAFGRVLANAPAVLGEGHEFVARARDYLGEEQPSLASVRPEVTPTPSPVPPAPAAPAPVTPASVTPAPVTPAPVVAVPDPVPQAPVVEIVEPARPDVRTAMEHSTEMLPVTRPVDQRNDARYPQPPVHQPPPPVHHQQVIVPQQQGWPIPPQPVTVVPQPYTESRSGNRAVAITLTAVATLISAVAVGALVVVLADRSQDEPVAGPGSPSAPVLSGQAPTKVELDDQGSTVHVNWADPTDGRNGFMVTMAREGQQLRPVSQVGPGKTTTYVAGLNPDLEYCFAVVAVYSTNQFASSKQVCTERA